MDFSQILWWRYSYNIHHRHHHIPFDHHPPTNNEKSILNNCAMEKYDTDNEESILNNYTAEKYDSGSEKSILSNYATEKYDSDYKRSSLYFHIFIDERRLYVTSSIRPSFRYSCYRYIDRWRNSLSLNSHRYYYSYE